MATTKTGYVNGSDLLLYVGTKAVGSCTSHTLTIDAETKERAVKPVASAGLSAGLFKSKGVVGLSVSISADGLCFYDETECGYAELYGYMTAGKSVEVKCMERGSETPYLTGKFVIKKLDQKSGAGDDATYSISLENDGVVTFASNAITVNTANNGSDD